MYLFFLLLPFPLTRSPSRPSLPYFQSPYFPILFLAFVLVKESTSSLLISTLKIQIASEISLLAPCSLSCLSLGLPPRSTQRGERLTTRLPPPFCIHISLYRNPPSLPPSIPPSLTHSLTHSLPPPHSTSTATNAEGTPSINRVYIPIASLPSLPPSFLPSLPPPTPATAAAAAPGKAPTANGRREGGREGGGTERTMWGPKPMPRRETRRRGPGA
jgi:hypothetical protein